MWEKETLICLSFCCNICYLQLKILLIQIVILARSEGWVLPWFLLFIITPCSSSFLRLPGTCSSWSMLIRPLWEVSFVNLLFLSAPGLACPVAQFLGIDCSVPCHTDSLGTIRLTISGIVLCLLNSLRVVCLLARINFSGNLFQLTNTSNSRI